ncbi:MAG: hypothetical protein LKE64_10105 [Solobacterium sp.]|nr:hypothetical protein [Solobacterium sp.]MCH4048423.1 hypothetical protein [Solobacterium sp.]MCH4074725.1 hypothetical protein [Solobacterium sp.]MCI1313906.1 hypothetical protein [Solobacterium sp.]MCI1346433.1 hypothetical protein [Solobacterium sp.]
MNNQEKETAQTSVPEGFTLTMALLDCLPVLFFSISAAILAYRFASHLFRFGIFLVILAGALKAGWKFVIAIQHKDIPLLSRQMRYLMPAGFLFMCIALLISHDEWSMTAVIQHIIHIPALFFFLASAAGILVLIQLARSQDSHDARANWKEQCINSFTQLFILLGILL